MPNCILNVSRVVTPLQTWSLVRNNLCTKPVYKFATLLSIRGSLVSTHKFDHCHRFYSSKAPFAMEKLEDGSKLIYTGSLAPQVKRIKWVSLTSSVLALSMLPAMYRAIVEPSSSTAISVAVGASAVPTTAFIFSPLLFHLLTKRYVTRLYFNEESRTFTLISLNFVNRTKVTSFTAKDVRVPLTTGLFTTFLVHGRPYYVDVLAFTDLQVYNHLMGYDLLDEREQKSAQKSSGST